MTKVMLYEMEDKHLDLLHIVVYVDRDGFKPEAEA